MAPRANSETRVTMSTDGGSRPAVERVTSAIRDDGNGSPSRERDDFARQAQSATSTTTQIQPGDVDTRVIGRPDKFDGDSRKYADWLFRQIMLRSRGPAVSAGTNDDRSIVKTKTQRDAQQ